METGRASTLGKEEEDVAFAIAAIFTHFSGVSDPRRPNARRHELRDLIVIALCAAICGSESWADVERFGREKVAWFRRFLRLEHGIPSHDTFGRVFARLDTGEFLSCLQNWVASLQHSMAGQHVALDGKTLRRSFDAAEGDAPRAAIGRPP